MMNKFFLILFFASFTIRSLGQMSVTIEIHGLRNNNGLIRLEFVNNQEKRIKGISTKIENNQSIITIDGLEPGEYSFKYFHDENSNEKLDTNWLGIPLEGFGFSNDAKGIFGPPDFEKTIFELTKNIKIVCHPTYYL